MRLPGQFQSARGATDQLNTAYGPLGLLGPKQKRAELESALGSAGGASPDSTNRMISDSSPNNMFDRAGYVGQDISGMAVDTSNQNMALNRGDPGPVTRPTNGPAASLSPRAQGPIDAGRPQMETPERPMDALGRENRSQGLGESDIHPGFGGSSPGYPSFHEAPGPINPSRDRFAGPEPGWNRSAVSPGFQLPGGQDEAPPADQGPVNMQSRRSEAGQIAPQNPVVAQALEQSARTQNAITQMQGDRSRDDRYNRALAMRAPGPDPHQIAETELKQMGPWGRIKQTLLGGLKGLAIGGGNPFAAIPGLILGGTGDIYKNERERDISNQYARNRQAGSDYLETIKAQDASEAAQDRIDNQLQNYEQKRYSDEQTRGLTRQRDEALDTSRKMGLDIKQQNLDRQTAEGKEKIKQGYLKIAIADRHEANLEHKYETAEEEVFGNIDGSGGLTAVNKKTGKVRHLEDTQDLGVGKVGAASIISRDKEADRKTEINATRAAESEQERQISAKAAELEKGFIKPMWAEDPGAFPKNIAEAKAKARQEAEKWWKEQGGEATVKTQSRQGKPAKPATRPREGMNFPHKFGEQRTKTSEPAAPAKKPPHVGPLGPTKEKPKKKGSVFSMYEGSR